MRRAVVPALALVLAACLASCSKSHHTTDQDADAGRTTTSASGGSTGSTTTLVPPVPATSATGCLALPTSRPLPAPSGLPPLPSGTQWFEATSQGSAHAYAAAVPEPLKTLQTSTVRTWKAQGWQEVSGESEPGREVEGVFRNGSTRLGLRARAVYCDKGWIEVRLSVVTQ
jgi:hypothetical protein